MVVLYAVKRIHLMQIYASFLICGPLRCKHVEVLESPEKEVFKCMDACTHTSPLLRGSVVEQGYSRAYSDVDGT